jgi:hypothetical protein
MSRNSTQNGYAQSSLCVGFTTHEGKFQIGSSGICQQWGNVSQLLRPKVHLEMEQLNLPEMEEHC